MDISIVLYRDKPCINHEVVMVRAEDRTSLVFNKDLNTKSKLEYRPDLVKDTMTRSSLTYQHLYIISKEDIKPFEKCWIYDSDKHIVFYNGRPENTKGLTPTNYFHKIVATTDKSLRVAASYKAGLTLEQSTYLALIPQSFVKTFVEVGGINEVLVECIPFIFWDSSNSSRIQLKIEPYHNTVTLHYVDNKFYTEEQLKKLFYNNLP